MSFNSQKTKRKEPKHQRRKRSQERSNIESVVDLILPAEGVGSAGYMLPDKYVEEKQTEDKDKDPREANGHNRFIFEWMSLLILSLF